VKSPKEALNFRAVRGAFSSRAAGSSGCRWHRVAAGKVGRLEEAARVKNARASEGKVVVRASS